MRIAFSLQFVETPGALTVAIGRCGGSAHRVLIRMVPSSARRSRSKQGRRMKYQVILNRETYRP
jgi:hypothetical protein